MTPSRPSVIRLSPELARAHADRPALVGQEPLSYAQFSRRVDALAARLLDIDVQVGDRVAIWMDKKPRYAEAIFAALHAGCAYVPLYGGQPAHRVATILTDSEPSVLCTDAHRLDALAECELPRSLKVIIVDAPRAPEETAASEPPGLPRTVGGVPVFRWTYFVGAAAGRVALLPALRPDDLAALLYTSGSTGTPKGVRLTHRNIAAFVGWSREEFDVGPDDVFANHASFNFDLSTFDLFVALTVGAAVWIVGDEQARDVTVLTEGIRTHGVTVWYSVPSILHLLASADVLTEATTRTLRYVLFAGEEFPLPQLRALAVRLGENTALYNLYGPTETNVCTFHRVRPEDLERDLPLPIGRPVSGARLTVVDHEGRVVRAPGTLGELIVEGDCVTPGYWRRDEEPAAADHCHGRHPTGDLVSYDVEGLLVYRGRRDRMVKLSGYRIELGEIEAAVLAHPDITDAAVTVRRDGARSRLELFYTLRMGAARTNLLQIKKHCAQRLPVYMLPHSATRLEELPRNANGKTDYRRLSQEPAQSIVEPSGSAR